MKKLISTIILFFLLFSFTPAQAEIITIGFTGLVDSVDDPYNLLENSIHQNDPITGFYIYDSATPDSEPSIYDGIYEHTTTPYEMYLIAGSLTFQTNLANVNLIIGLTNNYYGEPWDHYSVTSYNNLVLYNGVSVDRLHWQLDDYPGTALSSDVLPTTPLDLSQWQTNRLSISGGMYPFPSPQEKTLFGINGHATSVYLIPEPTTFLLVGIGGLFLRKRR